MSKPRLKVVRNGEEFTIKLSFRYDHLSVLGPKMAGVVMEGLASVDPRQFKSTLGVLLDSIDWTPITHEVETDG